MLEKAASKKMFHYMTNTVIIDKLNELIREIAFHPRDEKKISDLEGIVSVDACSSLVYALVTNKPFPRGEDAMATNAWTSCQYASSVLKRRFPLGENSIIASRRIKGSFGAAAYRDYIKMLRSRDPMNALLEDSQLGPFPKPAIRRKRKV